MQQGKQTVLNSLTAAGREQGLRAFFEIPARVLRCHQDVQIADGRGNALRYVSGYVPKMSSSFNAELLNDHATDFAVARNVPKMYHPLEQEQALQLLGKRGQLDGPPEHTVGGEQVRRPLAAGTVG